MIRHQCIGMNHTAGYFCRLLQTAQIFQIVKIIEKNSGLIVASLNRMNGNTVQEKSGFSWHFLFQWMPDTQTFKPVKSLVRSDPIAIPFQRQGG
jgi:hypothetical protein